MSYGVVYKITNLNNGKIYIGQTIASVDRRWQEHKSAAKAGEVWTICSAIRKHGDEAFSIEEIDKATCREELNALEIQYIGALKPQYNMCAGGGGLGSPTIEVRQKISAAGKGKKKSKEFSEKLSVRQTGRTLSESTKAKIRNAQVGRVYSDRRVSQKGRESIVVSNKARRIHPEAPIEIKTAMLGMSKNEKISYRALLNSKNISERVGGVGNPMWGKHHSEESKKRLSEMFSGGKNPYYGKKHSEEVLEKMRLAHVTRANIKCPHCSKSGIVSNMKRWHFDNCKAKNDDI